MYKTELGRIVIDSVDFDIVATLECGQLFRYEKNNDVYTVKSGPYSCKIFADGDFVVIETLAIDYFVKFFNLDRDVNRTKRELSRFPELVAPLNSCGALRILSQPLFETIISFIISANNNIPRIKNTINHLCDMFDDVFPSPEQLASLSVRQLDSIGCGYRSQYILDTATACAKTDVLNRLVGAQTSDAQAMLMNMRGVGQKVADCVTLFSLGRMEVFPVDTWILKTQREGMETENQLRSRLMERYGENAGYAQQFIYYYYAILKSEVSK